jgi:hypothetical protein
MRRGQDDLHHRALRHLAVFHCVEAVLHCPHRGRDDKARALVGAVEIRFPPECEVQLRSPPARPDVAGLAEKARIQMARPDKLLEGRARVDRRDDQIGRQELAPNQFHTPDAVALDHDPHRPRTGAQSHARRLGGLRHRDRDRSHPALRQGQRAALPRRLARQPVQQKDQRIGRARAKPCPQHRVKGKDPAQPVVGQIVLQRVGNVDQDHPQELAELFLAQLPHAEAQLRKPQVIVSRPARQPRWRHRLEGRKHPREGHEPGPHLVPGLPVGRRQIARHLPPRGPLQNKMATVAGE